MCQDLAHQFPDTRDLTPLKLRHCCPAGVTCSERSLSKSLVCLLSVVSGRLKKKKSYLIYWSKIWRIYAALEDSSSRIIPPTKVDAFGMHRGDENVFIPRPSCFQMRLPCFANLQRTTDNGPYIAKPRDSTADKIWRKRTNQPEHSDYVPAVLTVCWRAWCCASRVSMSNG